MDLKHTVAFITGANRGLGKSFVKALQAAGVKKIYAAARDPSSIDQPGVTPIQLDVTKPDQIAAVVRAAGDVTLLINNAGITRGSPLLGEHALTALRDEFETNVVGPLELTRAFAPVLKEHGGGAVVNVLSVLSWLNLTGAATYSVSKAATWSVTNGLRQELKDQGTAVLGLHVGFMDTDMTSGIDAPKADPLNVAQQVLDALAAGKDEVFADDMTRAVKAGLSADQGSYRGGI